jgi:DNA (cytosine-5)-methyltransferase 1
MPKKKSYITATDQFCGAGGSTKGAKDAGAEILLALNHWKLACETYNTNNQETNIDCTDISACDPRRYPSTDILITSPECTNHSVAKGAKVVKKQMEMFGNGTLDASAERSRATMWDVVRFAEYHKYRVIIVENVVDARKWMLFDAWLNAMHNLGYDHKCLYLNSMHCHPTPQSRDRMYVVFWQKGNKKPMLEYTPAAYCPQCGTNVLAVQTWKRSDIRFGKYKQQYVYCCPAHGNVVEPYYYAAFNCIDWSDLGTRIGDRAKDLSPNSKKRVLYGLNKFEEQPLLIHTLYSDQARGVARSAYNTAFTQTTLNSQAIVVPPFIVGEQNSTGLPLYTGATPFIIKGEHTMAEPMVRSIADTLQTQVTRQTFSLVTNESFNSFISYYYRTLQVSGINESLGTVPTKDRMSIVNYTAPNYEDCYFRILKAGEVKLAMAFDKNYHVCGSAKDQVKQLGNAVTPPAMEWIVEQVMNTFK